MKIKFRAWDKEKKVMSVVRRWDFAHGDIEMGKELAPEADKFEHEVELMQFTGLLDKNGLQEVYDGDIIDVYGKIIGNCWETPDLVKDEANLLIKGFGTSYWAKTEADGLDRGLIYAQ